MSANEPVVRGAILQELSVAARYGEEFVRIELEAAGVDAEEYGFLSFVGTLQPVTRTTLAAATGLRRTTLRDAIARLVERGHIEEHAHPRDRRARLLSLTPAGQAIFERGLPAFRDVLTALDGALDGQLDELEAAIRRVRVALQALGQRESLDDPP